MPTKGMVGGTKKSALRRELPAAIVTAGQADVSRSRLMRLLGSSAQRPLFSPLAVAQLESAGFPLAVRLSPSVYHLTLR